MSGSTATDPARHALWRRLLPWVVAVVLVWIVLSSIDLNAFWLSLKSVNIALYVAFAAVYISVNLLVDVLAAWQAYRIVTPELSYRDLLVVRGASYLPQIINFHVGQAYVIFLLVRRYRVPALSVLSAALLVYLTFFGDLVAIAAVAAPFAFAEAPWLLRSAGALVLLGVLYLMVLRLRPSWLLRVRLLTPLFETGVLGHVRLMFWRLPHALWLLLAIWISYWFFGVSVPLESALILIPVVALVASLPISPQGLGTRELVAMNLLAPFAPENIADPRAAVVAAGTAWTVISTISQGIVGLAFARAGQERIAEPGLASD